MATSCSWKTLIQRIAENLWPGRYPLTATVTTGATATFVALAAAYSSASVNAFDGAYIHIIYDAAGTNVAPEGETGQVTSGGFTAATGTFAVSPSFTVATAAGDIGLFHYGLRPAELLDAANDIQRTLYLPRYMVLSPITDGDMEAANTTSWVDVGTCVQTKSTTASEVLTGTQSLKLVITAGVTNGVTSAYLPVQDNENILVSVGFKTATSLGTISIVLYDVTNAAAIKTVTASSRYPSWIECRFEESVPSGCEQVAVRIMNASATAEATCYVDWVAAYPTWRNTLDLPSQVIDARDPEITYMSEGLSTDDSYIYNALGEFGPWPSEPLRDLRALTSHRIVVGKPISHPLFLKFRTTGTVMTGLTSTTEAPQELILHGALSICLKKLADRLPAHMSTLAAKADLITRSTQAGRVYKDMLDDLGLLRPQVRSHGTRRVPVPWS